MNDTKPVLFCEFTPTGRYLTVTRSSTAAIKGGEYVRFKAAGRAVTLSPAPGTLLHVKAGSLLNTPTEGEFFVHENDVVAVGRESHRAAG